MLIEPDAIGATVNFDLIDLHLLREVFYSHAFHDEDHWKDEPVKAAALEAMGTAFHAAIVACEHMAEGKTTP